MKVRKMDAAFPQTNEHVSMLLLIFRRVTTPTRCAQEVFHSPFPKSSRPSSAIVQRRCNGSESSVPEVLRRSVRRSH